MGPHDLKCEECRVRACPDFLRRDEADGTFLLCIITTDETWLHYFEPEGKRHSSLWKTPGNPPPNKARMMKSLRKNMFIVFLDCHGMLLVHAILVGQTVNAVRLLKLSIIQR